MSLIQNYTDFELFKIFVEKDKPEELFREIMHRYKYKVYAQVRRILVNHDDADEVTQLVFIKLWKNAESFRFGSALSSFIYRIAYNESISLLKYKKRFSSFEEISDTEVNNKSTTQEEMSINSTFIEKELQKALAVLPEKQRMVFHYRYFEDLTYKEISEITGTTEGGLKASYHHAYEKVKKILEQI